MQALASLFARTIDALIGRHGMALLYHFTERPRLDAWHDVNGAFFLEVGRFEFVRDKGLPMALRLAFTR